jgi:hypothetical protein
LAMARNIPSALGERQMLPVQTNNTPKAFGSVMRLLILSDSPPSEHRLGQACARRTFKNLTANRPAPPD